MLDTSDAAYLSRALSKNSVVLFLGSGFSRGAQNRQGEPIPLTTQLCRELWDYIGYEGDYDGSDLRTLFESALYEPGGTKALQVFLEERLLSLSVPSWYNALPHFYWYRIYTTNVDDVVETVYDRVSDVPDLNPVINPTDEPQERDQFLNSIQYVKLNGSLPGSPDNLTFSITQYAGRIAQYDPLYADFVADYAVRPTVFVGSELNEPIFWRHIELRDRRTEGSEPRPKSFLIAPDISPAKADVLDRYNVVPVEGTTKEFMEWLHDIADHQPSRRELLSDLDPNLALAFDTIDEQEPLEREEHLIQTFFEQFHQVGTISDAADDYQSFYLLGASPKWEDIAAGLDAEREINNTIASAIKEADDNERTLQVVALTGSAGCGKSTALRRVAFNLQAEGRHLYLTNSEDILPPSQFDKVLDHLPNNSVICFDNAEVSLVRIGHYLERIKDRDFPPTIVLAARTNSFYPHKENFQEHAQVTEIPIPNMTRADIDAVIDTLDDHNRLGRLRGMDPEERIRTFEDVAEKQILVAMREATTGKRFDKIIEDEYQELRPQEAKLLYGCVALATEAGFRLSTQQYVGCADVPPAEALSLLDNQLRQIVVRSGRREESLLVRHRHIAEEVVNNSAPRNLLSRSYVRILKVLAGDIVRRGKSSRNFRLYRELINHRSLFRRFSHSVSEARAIYEELTDFFKKDAHFWLQYGSLELEYGNLDIASNYIHQAESLKPHDYYIQTAKGHLLMKKAVEADKREKAIQLRDEGEALLSEQIRIRGDETPYPHHVRADQLLDWLHKWTDDPAQLKDALEELKEQVESAYHSFPHSRPLEDLNDKLTEEYMHLAVRDDD